MEASPEERRRSLSVAQRSQGSKIAKALGIGQASVYRVLEAGAT
jgi:hypothetical protein